MKLNEFLKQVEAGKKPDPTEINLAQLSRTEITQAISTVLRLIVKDMKGSKA